MKRTIELISVVTALMWSASAAISIKISRISHLTSSPMIDEALASRAPVIVMKPVTPVRWAIVSKPIRRRRVPTTRATRLESSQPTINRMIAPIRAGRRRKKPVTETSTASVKL